MTLPSTGSYTIKAYGTGGLFGGAFGFQLLVATPINLNLGVPYQGMLAGSGDSELFKVTVPTGLALSLNLNDATSSDHNELYTEFGLPPTRSIFDYGSTTAGNNQSLLVPLATPGTWYVLVYGESVRSASNFTLNVSAASVKLMSSNPDHAGNGAPATLTITGAGFFTGTTVSLVSSDGKSTYSPTSLSINSFTQITATFPANIPPGTYSVKATNASGSDTSPVAFTITSGGSAHLVTNLVLPSALGRHQTSTLYVKYSNTGTVAMPAPLLVLSNPNNDRPLLTLDQSKVIQGYWSNAIPDGFSTSISILASGSTPGVLQPGESVTVPVYYIGLQQPWDFTHTTVPFNLGVVSSTDTSAIDWNSLKSSLQPSWLDGNTWNAVYGSLVAQAGSTSGSYVQMLDSNTQYLSQLGESVTDVGQLWNFAIMQAVGFSPVEHLDTPVDLSLPAPGMSLTFGRMYHVDMDKRNALSTLGYGWSSAWQESLAVQSDGTVVITTDGGDQNRYQPDSRHSGVYFSTAGDSSTLTAGVGNTFTLVDASGNVTAFRSDGQIAYVQDTDGNKITAGYNASWQMNSLTDSSGAKLSLTYNAAGLIASVADSVGRQAVYTYDATNRYLMGVQTTAGTTLYTYSNGAEAVHFLSSIQNPDGTHQYFTYDSFGRLSSISRDNNASKLTYGYPLAGEVTATDADGGSIATFFDYRGLVAKTTDALGNATSYTYDPATLQLSKVTDPLGQSQTFTYGALGNMTSSTDALGHKTLFTYGAFSKLTSLTDANGNKTAYAYDPSGNLLSTTYADGSVESSTFDPLGDPLSFTNRNGQAVNYTYNSAGQPTRQTFPDGTHTDFTYDAHGNLKTATDATGTITFTYDTADRLTRVDYPNGMFLQFTLDSGGRRIKMVDQTGFATNYTYDAAGRLSGLSDGSNNPIVTYTYDAASYLVRKDNGNGTYTTYQYDANGNVLHLINYAPGAVVNSRFDYTYDALGRRTTMATVDGTWTYSYDGTGQLTHAVFVSTNPNVPSQDLTYHYDALGNRTSTLINGVSTVYTSNNLNEYTSVGGVAQTYDADGNLLNDGTNTYTYDTQDRLISVIGPSNMATYTYNALGSRSSSTTNGLTTHYLNDPTGLTNVVGEFDGTGNLIAHNTYGFGLASRVIGGNSYYFDFDALGSTVGLTGSNGVYVNNYSYLPFGGSLSSTSRISNPFQFVGQYGVTMETDGLTFMRDRFDSMTQGRFLSVDPLRLLGGQTNFYTYAAQNPVSFIDPTGLCVTKAEKDSADASFDLQILNLTHLQNILNNSINAELAIDAALFALQAYPAAVALLATIGLQYGLLTELQNEIADVNYEKSNEDRMPICPDPPPPPPPTPPVNPPPSGGGFCPIPKATDPNDKFGPIGYSTPNFVQSTELLPYRIDFENATTATAPAQVVTITDQLSSNLNWSTFSLTEIAWGDVILSISAGSQHFQATVPMTYIGQTFGVIVEAGIRTDTGQVYATFQSLDPNTSLPPDVLTGFLPPEDGTGRGMGHISYSVLAKSGLPTGTQITNVALITFDQNTSIATDQVSETDPTQGIDPTKLTLITLDAVAPTSTIAALPNLEKSPNFTLSWSGQDDTGGSGVASYNIYVSVNGGAFTPFLLGTTATSATFNGSYNQSYGFYSVATDNVGNRQATPTAAEATTKVDREPSTASLTASANPSAYGQSITFTAQISPIVAGTGTPSGTVTFLDGTNALGTATLNASGIATFATSALAVGSHSISVVYGGDVAFMMSTSTALSLAVNQASTATTITASANPAIFGQSVTLTALVAVAAPGAGTPSGMVTFNDGSGTLGTGTLITTAGVTTATFTTSSLAIGSHSVTAVYAGDGNDVGSTSSVMTLVINASNGAPVVGDAGFELVAVGTGNFAYDPTGSPWAFSGSSGISANNSGFTSGNPVAPDGVQVAFLQGTGYVTQLVGGWAAGTYAISFEAAQRNRGGMQVEDFEVLVDGVKVTTLKPSGTSYQGYTTATFSVGAGSHSIEFAGLDTAGGDNTAFLDGISIAPAVGDTAKYLKTDAATEGGWQSAYGGDGYQLAGGASSLPSYASLAASGASAYTWTSTSSDPRALQVPGSTDRLAAAYYSSTSMSFALGTTDGQAHTVSIYALDWDDHQRSERVDIVDTATGAVLDSRTLANFQKGVYLAWLITGDVTIVVTNTGGAGNNALLNGVFLGAPAVGDTAKYLKSDAATEGGWQSAYGGDGYQLAGGASSLPSYASLAASGASAYTWTSTSSDPRALQVPGSTDRLAAAYYSSTSMSFALGTTDGQAHTVSIYALDWDDHQRSERVDIVDTATGAVLDSRTLANFQKGVYLAWLITGDVTIVVTNTGGAGNNALLNGVFFG